MRRPIQMPARTTVDGARRGVDARVLLAVLGLTMASLALPAEPVPFDKALFELELPLRTWHDPADLASNWSGKNVVLRNVYLSAEGHWKNEIYAGS